ncbi:MAG: hypothetical protein V4508_02700 [Pseudomonadota bacterium]
MSTLKILAACGLALAVASAHAVTSTAATDAPKKPALKKPAAKAKAKAKPAEATPDEAEPDITNHNAVDFNCELGNKITVYRSDADESHIALRWKKRLHRLTRVGTTTGALRFENPVFGLIWIGIPAKAMLLDSKQNRQLANECKSAEQAKPVVPADMFDDKKKLN